MINATMIRKQQNNRLGELLFMAALQKYKTNRRVVKAFKGYVRRQNKRENLIVRFWILLRDSRDLQISRTDAWRVIRQQCQEGA